MYGLLSVASVTTGGGTWQLGGVEYDSDACAQGGYVPGFCPIPLPTEEQTGEVTATPHAENNTVTLEADAGNDFPVYWAVASKTGGAVITGVLVPGDTAPDLEIPAGNYSLQVQAYGHSATEPVEEVVVPGGEPVSGTATIAASDPGTTHDKTVAEGLNHVMSPGPVTVYARSECNAVGFNDPEGVARRRIAMVENREIERFFSRYLLGAVGARFPVGTTGVPLKEALGALEQDAALHYGGTPTLHTPRWTNPYFRDLSLLQSNQATRPVLRTGLESRTAFGGGYYNNPFVSEQQMPEGLFMLVATGTVRAWRSSVFVSETFTEATNLRAAIAERTYLFDADCYRAAVLVDLNPEE